MYKLHAYAYMSLKYLQNVKTLSELEFSRKQYPSNLSILFLKDICKFIGKNVSSNGTVRKVLLL